MAGAASDLPARRRLRVDGADVTIMGRNPEKLEKAVGEIRSVSPDADVRSFAGDVGNEQDVIDAVARAAADDGLDIAVANAGTGALAPIMVTESDSWESVIKINSPVLSTPSSTRARRWRSRVGRNCAISSIAGVRTHRFMGSYCVSKAGIDMLVRDWLMSSVSPIFGSTVSARTRRTPRLPRTHDDRGRI
ncbi:MAG: SDR family NAD(P)-dependent oxidoreductase [Gammaproteobacteria bacterium]|nr:SDR family NAD(P)-dependent oxidoreductase [Gammaproteobacteria bacterium]